MPPFAEFVRRRARQLGLSQGDVARRAGISRQGLVKLLSGDTRNPRIDTVRRLASAIVVNPIYLFQLLFERSLVEEPLKRDGQDAGDHSFFVEDVTIPNGLIIPPGYRFEKIWRIQNGGIVPWGRRQLRCVSDYRGLKPEMPLVPDRETIEIPDTQPGEVVDLAMWFTAPLLPCTCISEWKMLDASTRLTFPDLPPLNVVVTVSSM